MDAAEISATKSRKDMVDGAFESWNIVLAKSVVLMTVRTHPEELRVLQNNTFLIFYMLTVDVLR